MFYIPIGKSKKCGAKCSFAFRLLACIIIRHNSIIAEDIDRLEICAILMRKSIKPLTWMFKMSKSQLAESFGFMAAPRSDEEMKWQARFINEVESETTRGAVLNMTSFIDELLIKLLRSYFPNSQHADSLLKNLDSCISSIMDRANIAYALALLKKKEFEAIKIIARIRNEFAHKWDGSGFDSGEVPKLIEKLPRDYFEYVDGSNKSKFNFVCSQIIQEFLERHYYASHLSCGLPKEYMSIFDLTLEERQKIMKKERTLISVLLTRSNKQ